MSYYENETLDKAVEFYFKKHGKNAPIPNRTSTTMIGIDGKDYALLRSPQVFVVLEVEGEGEFAVFEEIKEKDWPKEINDYQE
jgi:hypothetical protein